MKNIVAIAATALTLILSSCAKDGIQGPTGTNGTNGNANVRVFYYSDDSVKNAQDFDRTLPVSNGFVDSSLVLVYYIDASNPTTWYWSPGLGFQNSYQTKPYIWAAGSNGAQFSIRIANPDGGSYTGPTVKLAKVKIVIAPGSTFGKKDPVDYSDYKATMRYYHLPE